jgi:peptidoglycan/xylan/chitin deacetylase (PgdA/CDA1 family)
MRRSSARTGSAILAVAVIGGLASAGVVGAQEGVPLQLGQPVPPKATPAPVAVKPAVPVAAKPQTAAKPVATPTAKPAATAQKPDPKAAQPAKTAAAPADKKAAPKPAKSTAEADAARAAKIAAMTAQPMLPRHDHVFETPAKTACANPDAIGVSRVMKVDTTGGYYVGTTYHTRLPLQPKEVVLTFDDGPMAVRTDRVLKALDDECTKATFFIVGQMAKAYPETLRKTAAAGHTIAYHTMTHPLNMVKWPLPKAQENVRDGWQTVDHILYGQAGDKPATPFFRYPGLFNSRALNEWFNGLDMGVWTIDAAGNDWLRGYLTIADGPNVMNEALKEIEARQGGILLLHDIKDSSSSIVGPLLKELKARGYRIVHVVPKTAPPKLVTGPIKGVMPTISETTAPLPERSVDNFDAARQLAQMGAGRTGKTSTAPLPAYDARATAQPAAAKAQPVIVPIAATASESDPETTGSIGPRVVREEGWFTSTASSFRGLGGALGLW